VIFQYKMLKVKICNDNVSDIENRLENRLEKYIKQARDEIKKKLLRCLYLPIEVLWSGMVAVFRNFPQPNW
jgi:hypothetical protein